MTMNKFFTGLIAFVAGVALSAGSAFATPGYVGGDPALMKLVPYYETGDTKATIIGIQNLSPQHADTMALHAAVTAAQAALDALNEMDDPNLQMVADAEMVLADAMDALQTEHLFVSVNVYNADGTMMEDASAELCLAEHQFGVVVLQGPAAMMADGDQMATLSMMDGDIPAYGYVEIAAADRWSACAPTAGDRGEAGWHLVAGSGTGRLASWAIIQDVGMGFFGTEVQSATLSMSMVPGVAEDADQDNMPEIAAGDAMLACYSGAENAPGRDTTADPTGATPDDTGVASNMTGDFLMTRCGLIPERHDNSRDDNGAPAIADGNNAITLTDPAEDRVDERAAASAATPRAHVMARYGTGGDDSTVYVWLATGEDTTDTHASMSRMLDVTIVCEGGMMIDMMQDQYGDDVPLQVPAPNKLTMIDPDGDMLGMYTGMCAGDRGVLRITMPDGSTAGSAFTHITQLDGHFRMNFPAYSAANPMTCFEMTAAAGDTNGNGTIDTGDGEVLMDVNGDGPDTLVNDDEFAAARANACMAR